MDYATIIKQAIKFTSEENARRYQAGITGKPMWLVLGEVGAYLLVSPANAQRLERLGFEILVG